MTGSASGAPAVATAAAFDLECELLTPEQAHERYPVMAVDDLVGAIWLPGDGKANPTDLTQALAKGARMRGARIFERTVSSSGSTGLGLALARDLAEADGGRLELVRGRPPVFALFLSEAG